MAQKKETPVTTNSAEQFFGKNVSQASLAALNALAAAYSMAPSSYSPFYPYSVLPFGVAPQMHPGFVGDFSQAVSSGFPFWPNVMGADYMLNMATLHNLQSPPAAATTSSTNGNGNIESFSEILKKMPRPPSSTADHKKGDADCRNSSSVSSNDHHANAATKSSSSKRHHQQHVTVNKPSTSASSATAATSGVKCSSSSAIANPVDSAASRYNLATLAEVATSLTSGDRCQTGGSYFSNNNVTRDEASRLDKKPKSEATSVLDFSRKRSHVASKSSSRDEHQPESKMSRQQLHRSNHNESEYKSAICKKEDKHDNRNNSESSSKKQQHIPSSASAENKKFSPTDIFAGLTNNLHNINSNLFGNLSAAAGTSSSSDMKMDPNLLNASAMVWSALSNQLLMAANMQNEMIRNNVNSNSNNNVMSNSNLNSTSTNSRPNENHRNSGGRSKDKVAAPIAVAMATKADNHRAHHQQHQVVNQKPNKTSGDNNHRSNDNSFKINGSVIVDCGPTDSVDDTINAVIRSKMCVEKHSPVVYKVSKSQHPSSNSSSSSHRSRNRRSRGSRVGATVREQLALRRRHDDVVQLVVSGKASASPPRPNSSPAIGAEDSDASVLDLSLKVPSSALSAKTSRLDAVINNLSRDDSASSPAYGELTDGYESGCESSSKKRKIAETDLVRIPLTKGWRRQTCIRSITATGIRGDVIYYAPCGRRLGSYAEVVRYVNKNKIRDISRDHFSFSCKVLVGEFLHVRPDNAKNGIVPLSENEVRDLVSRVQLPTQSSNTVDNMTSSVGGVNFIVNSCTTNSSMIIKEESGQNVSGSANRNSNSRRRGRPASGGMPQYTSKSDHLDRSKIKVDMDATMNEDIDLKPGSSKDANDRTQPNDVMHALRSKAANEIVRRNQMEMLRKQEEEYMRQVMILADWEREKSRQQALFARALESKRRQEQREQVYAEKLIREEERLAARNAYLQKMRQQRLPIEDLNVEEVKPLAKLDRIENLSLDGQAFADLLMVMEFVWNFGHVLKISEEEIPKLDDVHAGLFNDRRRVRSLLTLAKILLILVLEYPGLPNGQYGKTFLGLPAKDSSVNFENLSELLRMFLQTRGDEGMKLATLLNDQPYEALSPGNKVAMLAFMCNELLYCRNVVREIESNIDLSAKLKTDKWILEGKLKHLKAVQASKQCNKNYPSKPTSVVSPLETSTTVTTVEEVAKTTTPVVVEPPTSFISDEENNKIDCEDDDTLEKVRLKMIAETEPISVEEKNMSVEEVDKGITDMSQEIEDLNTKMCDCSTKVRSLPVGEDRYCRLYWTLPNVTGVLVESLESCRDSNPTVPSILSQPKFDHFETDVAECLDDMLYVLNRYNDVDKLEETYFKCNLSDLPNSESSSLLKPNSDSASLLKPNSDSPSSLLKPNSDSSLTASVFVVDCEPSCSYRMDEEFLDLHKSNGVKNVSLKSVDAHLHSGWWIVNDSERLCELRQSLTTQGIRERQLNRSLTKQEEFFKRVSFDESRKNALQLSVVKRRKNSSSESVTLLKMRRVYRNLQNLEDKIFQANVHSKNWRPPDATSNERNIDLDETLSATPASDSTVMKPVAPMYHAYGIDQFVTIIQKRLAQLEQNIERRYFLPVFNRSLIVPQSSCPSSSIPATPALESRDTSRRSSVVASEMSDNDTTSSVPERPQNESCLKLAEVAVAVEDADNGNCDDDEYDGVTPALHRWRNGVTKARTPAQLMLCIEALDSNIAWERSVMKASCQICRRGDDDSHLLLCDGCDLGYHTYCFKPKMDNIPEGDWYCPECVSKATRRACCLLCCRQTTRPMIICVDCQRNFHVDCIDASKKQSRSGWICDGCLSMKMTPSESPKKVNKPSPSKKSKSKSSSSSSGAKVPSTQEKRKHTNSSSSASTPVSVAATPTTAMTSSTPTATTSSPLQFNELCSIVLAELDVHKDSWPFKSPVDMKVFPLYKKIIKNPTDLSIIQTKLNDQKYENGEQFVTDVKLIFDNCKTFNEDDSPVGKAGHNLRRFFNKRWKEINEMSSSSSNSNARK